MRYFIAIALAICAALPAHAQLVPLAGAPITAPVAPKKTEPNEADLQTHGHYVNKAGQAVHSPAKAVDGKVPTDASAQCRDGSYSFSKSHRGTCSHHGGVASWL